jgi:putative polyhydroxyalkanoate system protein
MTPISVNVPHKLGAAEARRRIESGTSSLVSHLPGGATATPRWNGDQLELEVSALGQEIRAKLDVQDTLVRVALVVPSALSFLAPMIESGIRRSGAEMLQDQRKA